MPPARIARWRLSEEPPNAADYDCVRCEVAAGGEELDGGAAGRAACAFDEGFEGPRAPAFSIAFASGLWSTGGGQKTGGPGGVVRALARVGIPVSTAMISIAISKRTKGLDLRMVRPPVRASRHAQRGRREDATGRSFARDIG